MRHFLAGFALLSAGCPSLAAPLLCQDGNRFSVTVHFDEAGQCIVDRIPGIRKDEAGSRTCRISNPQLRIFTLQEGGQFTYEDTDDDRIFRGTCTSG